MFVSYYILYQNSENNDSETDQKDMPLILPFKNNTNTNVWGLQFALIYRLETLTADKTRQKRLLFLQTSLEKYFFFEVEKNFPTEIP